MSWKTIRLELARAPRFPRGSASRAYLLHLPVDESGAVEEEMFARAPALATARRHWPSERDRVGYVRRHHGRWVVSFPDGPSTFQLPDQLLRAGAEVNITESDGETFAYRVMGSPSRAAPPATHSTW